MKYPLRWLVCSFNVLVLLTASVAMARDLAEVKKSGLLIAGPRALSHSISSKVRSLLASKSILPKRWPSDWVLHWSGERSDSTPCCPH
jgi:hypothetical protein